MTNLKKCLKKKSKKALPLTEPPNNKGRACHHPSIAYLIIEMRCLSIPDSKAKKAWVKANTTRVVLNLNHNTDKDVLLKLDEVPSKQGYIKSLIRQDVAKT